MNRFPPLISVIIPTFNRAAFLPEALASVQAQNIAPLQVIVVDDGSTDDTAEVMRGLNASFEYIYQPNRGPAAARNTGLCHAQGEWIAFLDSDDLWAAGRLHRQLALVAAYPTARVIWGMVQIIRQSATKRDLFESYMQPTLRTHLGSALIQRSLFADSSVGMLDEALTNGEDADWFCRLLEQKLEIVTHQEVVLFYRWHLTNLLANQPDSNKKATNGLMVALMRSLQRRRQAVDNNLSNAMHSKIHWV